MASSQPAAKPAKPLAMMTRLSPLVSYYKPPSTAAATAATAAPQRPRKTVQSLTTQGARHRSGPRVAGRFPLNPHHHFVSRETAQTAYETDARKITLLMGNEMSIPYGSNCQLRQRTGSPRKSLTRELGWAQWELNRITHAPARVDLKKITVWRKWTWMSKGD